MNELVFLGCGVVLFLAVVVAVPTVLDITSYFIDRLRERNRR